jgi:hypothetical protein
MKIAAATISLSDDDDSFARSTDLSTGLFVPRESQFLIAIQLAIESSATFLGLGYSFLVDK